MARKVPRLRFYPLRRTQGFDSVRVLLLCGCTDTVHSVSACVRVAEEG